MSTRPPQASSPRRLAAAALLIGLLLLVVMAGPTAPAAAGEGPGRLIRLQTADVTLTPGIYEVNGRHIVLQLDHNLQQAEVAALAASGVRLLSYLGDGAFIAGVDPGALTAGVRAAYDIRAATPWTVANKATPALRRGEVDASAWTEAGLLEVVVLFFADMTEGEMTAILGRHAAAFQPETPPLLWSAEIAPAELAGLLGEQGIHVVKPGPVLFLPTLDNVRKIIHADEVQQATITDSGIQYAGLTGQGIHLQVSEFAWDRHPDFITKDGEWRFVDSNPEYGDIHGTLVGGIMAGDGELSATLADTPAYAPLGQWRGIAPEATLIEFGAEGLEIDASNHSYCMQIFPCMAGRRPLSIAAFAVMGRRLMSGRKCGRRATRARAPSTMMKTGRRQPGSLGLALRPLPGDRGPRPCPLHALQDDPARGDVRVNDVAHVSPGGRPLRAPQRRTQL